MVKDDLAKKNRQGTPQRKGRDSEEDSVAPLLEHIYTGKCSGNSHIRVQLPKKEMIFPLSNKAQSVRAVEANFIVCFSLPAVICSTWNMNAMNEMWFVCLFVFF